MFIFTSIDFGFEILRSERILAVFFSPKFFSNSFCSFFVNLLSAIKEASMDCLLHTSSSNPLKCYTVADPSANKFTYKPNINKESLNTFNPTILSSTLIVPAPSPDWKPSSSKGSLNTNVCGVLDLPA